MNSTGNMSDFVTPRNPGTMATEDDRTQIRCQDQGHQWQRAWHGYERCRWCGEIRNEQPQTIDGTVTR